MPVGGKPSLLNLTRNRKVWRRKNYKINVSKHISVRLGFGSDQLGSARLPRLQPDFVRPMSRATSVLPGTIFLLLTDFCTAGREKSRSEQIRKQTCPNTFGSARFWEGAARFGWPGSPSLANGICSGQTREEMSYIQTLSYYSIVLVYYHIMILLYYCNIMR